MAKKALVLWSTPQRKKTGSNPVICLAAVAAVAGLYQIANQIPLTQAYIQMFEQSLLNLTQKQKK
jgi:hypothetical protein